MKIKSKRVITCENPTPVYDIEVPGNSNFALSCGTLVHNSKDISDALCGAVWNAQKYYADKKQTNVVQHQNVKKAVEYLGNLNKQRWANSNGNMDPDDSWILK